MTLNFYAVVVVAGHACSAAAKAAAEVGLEVSLLEICVQLLIQYPNLDSDHYQPMPGKWIYAWRRRLIPAQRPWPGQCGRLRPGIAFLSRASLEAPGSFRKVPGSGERSPGPGGRRNSHIRQCISTGLGRHTSGGGCCPAGGPMTFTGVLNGVEAGVLAGKVAYLMSFPREM
jgi:hypothetical protein